MFMKQYLEFGGSFLFDFSSKYFKDLLDFQILFKL